MPRNTKDMQKLLDLREQIVVQITAMRRDLDALQYKLSGVDAAIAAVGGGVPATASKRARNVKKTVLGIVSEAGSKGVTSIEVLERAGMSGKQLDRGSVSSLLSRLKREGALQFDGERYRPVGLTAEPPEPSLKVVK